VTFEPKEIGLGFRILWLLAVIQYADPECSRLGWLIGTKSLGLIMEGAIQISITDM